MGLRDVAIARAVIPAGGTTLSVRGLSFADLSRLVIDHRDDFIAAVATVRGSDAVDMGAMAAEIARMAPGLVAKVIALACDEPDLTEAAGSLPAPEQMDVLMAVGKLTFVEPGAAPKFFASLTGLLEQGRQQIPTR